MFDKHIIHAGCFGNWYVVSPDGYYTEFGSQAAAEQYCADAGFEYVVR